MAGEFRERGDRAMTGRRAQRARVPSSHPSSVFGSGYRENP
ncbi:hypothetical protein MYA_1500 [Burkholderia sp. KJ006]|nr:hypothetical protein MYA_1500 [Burkholderia sp. KJ006]